LEKKDNLMTNNLRIVFMGTPEFAVSILEKLHREGLNIVGVVTAPDKPAGRGQKINQSAVKEYAISNQLNLLQPTNLKDSEFVNEIKKLNADLFVVVAFRMLPEVIWSMPPKGTINLHASLLPNYRGAAPINWAIINGEKETGVSTFFIEKEIDTGKIIDRKSTPINENENVGELYERLMTMGADLMFETVNKIQNENIDGQKQVVTPELKSAPKIFKQDCEINFNQTATNVHNLIRGLSPYPGAWAKFNLNSEQKTIKFFKSTLTDIKVEGSKILVGENGILIPCSDFYISISELQAEGKRKMNYKDYLAGNSVESMVIPS